MTNFVLNPPHQINVDPKSFMYALVALLSSSSYGTVLVVVSFNVS